MKLYSLCGRERTAHKKIILLWADGDYTLWICQNHGVILKKPITYAQELVNKALVELDDYYRSPEFINGLTAKLTGQTLPSNSDQLTFLFDKLINEVKTEMLVNANLQKNIEPVGFFQQALYTTVNFATNHPFWFGAICIGTAGLAGYFLYPYVKTLLGISGSAIVGGSTGNLSGIPRNVSPSENNPDQLSSNSYELTSNAIVNKKSTCIEDVKELSEQSKEYIKHAKKWARGISENPKISSMGDADTLYDQLKATFYLACEAHNCVESTVNAAIDVDPAGKNAEVNQILKDAKLTSTEAECIRQKLILAKAYLDKYDAQFAGYLPGPYDDFIQSAQQDYEKSKIDVAELLESMHHTKLE